VKAGKYPSVDDAMNAAVDRLRTDEQFEPDAQDWAAIEESEKQIERGEVRNWEEVRAELRQKYLGK
jgi:Arc/MetJ-type ribon-helix-helix transcriptional regulator